MGREALRDASVRIPARRRGPHHARFPGHDSRSPSDPSGSRVATPSESAQDGIQDEIQALADILRQKP